MLAFIPNRTLAGVIRGHQVAQHLGREVNPPTDMDCTRIYIKQWPSPQWPEGSYLDVMDGLSLREPMMECPHIRMIAFTESSRNYLAKFFRREVAYIPQHHCNFERCRREPREIRVVGFIGSVTSLAFYRKYKLDYDVWTKAFADAGFEFRYKLINLNTNRQTVIDFYKQLDIQLYAQYTRFTFNRFKDQLKMINAGSFGIPSVAKQNAGDCTDYLHAESMEEMIAQCVRLRDNPSLYEDLSQKLVETAEPYHIDNIARYYLELEQRN